MNIISTNKFFLIEVVYDLTDSKILATITFTICPRSSDPIHICNLLYKVGHYFLDTQYLEFYVFENEIERHMMFYLSTLFTYLQRFLFTAARRV